MPNPGENPSVIDQVTGFEWSSEDSVAFETAIEAANAAVGSYSARIAAEEAKATPDPTVIAASRAGQAEITSRREQLDPADRSAVARARQDFVQLTQAVRQGRA